MELLSLEMISQYGKQTQEKALEAIGYLQRSPNEFCTVWRKGIVK